MNHDLESTTAALIASGKGILAADETVPTLTKRFDTLGIQSTEESRRTYREMLFTAPGLGEFISGAIMYDETIRQRSSGGTPLAEVLARIMQRWRSSSGRLEGSSTPGCSGMARRGHGAAVVGRGSSARGWGFTGEGDDGAARPAAQITRRGMRASTSANIV
jgi:hypothetical protein